MPDLYARISEVAPEIQERLAGGLEMRAADARQREMLKSYLSEIAFPKEARALEIGCGTGAVTRTLASWPGVSKVVGVDPSATFIAAIHARRVSFLRAPTPYRALRPINHAGINASMNISVTIKKQSRNANV